MQELKHRLANRTAALSQAIKKEASVSVIKKKAVEEDDEKINEFLDPRIRLLFVRTS